MQTINEFMKKMFSIPFGWRIWLIALMFLNMAMPWVFMHTREAQLTFTAIMIGFFTGLFLYKRQGFTRLLGLMHWPWLFLVPFLLSGLGTTEADNLYGLWLRVVITFNSISLLLDGIDVARYLAGERQPII